MLAATMTSPRAFFVGLLTAVALLVLARFGNGAAGLLALAAVLLAYTGTAVFGAGTRGWRTRLLRGTLGALIACAGALAVFPFSKGRNHWFDWPADSAGDIFLVVLLSLAAFPGFAAAAAGRLRGLALASGLALALGVTLLQGTPPAYGWAVLLGVGTVLGTLVGLIGTDHEAREERRP